MHATTCDANASFSLMRSDRRPRAGTFERLTRGGDRSRPHAPIDTGDRAARCAPADDGAEAPDTDRKPTRVVDAAAVPRRDRRAHEGAAASTASRLARLSRSTHMARRSADLHRDDHRRTGGRERRPAALLSSTGLILSRDAVSRRRFPPSHRAKASSAFSAD